MNLGHAKYCFMASASIGIICMSSIQLVAGHGGASVLALLVESVRNRPPVTLILFLPLFVAIVGTGRLLFLSGRRLFAIPATAVIVLVGYVAQFVLFGILAARGGVSPLFGLTVLLPLVSVIAMLWSLCVVISAALKERKKFGRAEKS